MLSTGTGKALPGKPSKAMESKMTTLNTMQYAHFIAKRNKAHGSRLAYRKLFSWALREAYRIVKSGFDLATDVAKFKKIDRRIAAEKAVVRAVVRQALKTGHTVSLFDGEEWTVKQSSSEKEIMAEVMATDEETLKFRKDGEVIGSVFFVYGNSAGEVIADCTACPEVAAILIPAERRQDRYAEMGI